MNVLVLELIDRLKLDALRLLQCQKRESMIFRSIMKCMAKASHC